MHLKPVTFPTLVFLLLTGCSTAQLYKLEPAPVSSHPQLIIQDQRPAIQKSSELLSLMITNEAYGIARMGDESTSPERITFLRDMLKSLVGEKIGNRPVIVKTFTIHRNTQAKMRNSNVAKQAPLTKLITDNLETRAGLRQPGGYELSENPSAENVAVIDVVVEIGNKDYSARVVRPAPGTAVRFNTEAEIWGKVIDAALHEAVSALATEIKKG